MSFRMNYAVFVGLALSVAIPALAQESNGKLDGKGKEIVVFLPSRSNAYVGEWFRGAEESAKEDNYKLTVVESNFDQTEQDARAQQRLSMPNQPAAYVWWPADNKAGVATLRRLNRTGVPVFQVNQGLRPEAKDLVVAYAGVDDFFNGQIAAKNGMLARDAFVKAGGKLHSEGGNLVILKYIPGYSAGDDREAGFKEGTKDKPFNIVATEFAGFDTASGYKVMSQLIPSLRQRGIDFVYGMSDGSNTGSVKALEEAGITPGKDVYLFGGNCIADSSAISSAKEFATSVQSANLEGWFSINVVARYFEFGGQVKEGQFIAPDTADALPDLNFPISKSNIIPNPQVVVGADPAKAAEVLAKFRLWGKSFKDHCNY